MMLRARRNSCCHGGQDMQDEMRADLTMQRLCASLRYTRASTASWHGTDNGVNRLQGASLQQLVSC